MLFSVSHAHGRFDLELPPPADRESFFVFSVHKAGSVLLDSVIEDLCGAAQIPGVNLDRECFIRGVLPDGLDPDYLQILHQRGYCFYGFRALPFFHERSLTLSAFQKIVLIRDIRDMVVSHYFSMMKSHGLPDKGEARDVLLAARAASLSMDIDAYVLSGSADHMAKSLASYAGMQPRTRLYRYEDIIFAKRAWLTDICDFLGLDLPSDTIIGIADRHDIRPTDEDATRHVRQVFPGNHKKHLKPETINQLTERYRAVLEAFNYI